MALNLSEFVFPIVGGAKDGGKLTVAPSGTLFPGLTIGPYTMVKAAYQPNLADSPEPRWIAVHTRALALYRDGTQ